MPFEGWAERRPRRTERAALNVRRCRSGGRLALLAVPVLALLLAACGEEEQPAATTAPPTGAAGTEPAAAATTGGGAPPTVVAPSGGTSAGSPAASPGGGGGPLTLGVLADRMDAAWAGVRSFRAVVTTGTAAASPVASPAAGAREVTIEAVLPGRQRQVTRVDGADWLEALAIDGRVFVRGPLARSVRPDAGAEAWVAVDPATLDPAGELGQALGGLLGPLVSPGATIPDNLRAQEPRPLGVVEVAGRACQAYAAAATTEIGGRIDLTYALAEDGRPCFVETASGDAVGRITYEAYDLPLVIEPPANPLPAASPVVPATPAGRD